MKQGLSIFRFFCPAICPCVFLELDCQISLDFDMVLENLMKQCVTYFGKTFFCPKNWRNGPKIEFYEFIEKIGSKFLRNLFYNENLYYLLCSYTNVISGKFFSRDMSQNVLNQSDCRISLSTISSEQIIKQLDFLHIETYFHKTKVDQKIFQVGIVENSFGHSGHGTLKLNVSQD